MSKGSICWGALAWGLTSAASRYKLLLYLPHKVDEDKGSAKYDTSKQQLVVTLPIIRDIDYRDLPY